MGFWTIYEQVLEVESIIYKVNNIFQLQQEDGSNRDSQSMYLIDEACQEFKDQIFQIFETIKPNQQIDTYNFDYVMLISRVENYQQSKVFHQVLNFVKDTE